MILGIDVFVGKAEMTDAQMPLLFLAMCAGPSISGLLMTFVIDGRKGLGAMGKRLARWKLNFRGYLFALLAVPIVTVVTVAMLSSYSPRFIGQLLTLKKANR